MEAIKQRIQNYWTKRADSFMEQRLREMTSEKHDRWLTEFRKYLPGDRRIRVLDAGTGTGFFSFLLQQEGCETVGIDLTESMIADAKKTAALLGMEDAFYIMDAEHPDFAPESFDAVVTRNLTWTLPHLEEAYASWFRLLRPGGVLINFDADYCYCVTKKEEHVLPENHTHKKIPPEMMAENDAITLELAAGQQRRPAWDVALLEKAGFSKITVDTGVWERIYAEKDEFYNPTPIFTIAAYKPAEGGAK